MGNAGLWDGIHATLTEPHAYGVQESYHLGAEWLKDCTLVEDWGCGAGYFSTIFPRCRGIDGSNTRFADVIADLAEYRSEVPGVFMRHVLEHNPQWEKVLDNALASFTERMFLVLFTELSEETHDTEWEDPPGVPNFSFRLEDLTDRMDCEYEVEHLGNAMPYGLRTPKQVGTETVFRLWR